MSRFGLFAVLAAAVLSVFPGSSLSRTWHVEVDGSGDVPTIQAAIDAASMDDSILVGPGTYTWSNQGTGDALYGMIKMLKDAPALTIVGEMGASMTILDGESMGRVFYLSGLLPGDARRAHDRRVHVHRRRADRSRRTRRRGVHRAPVVADRQELRFHGELRRPGRRRLVRRTGRARVSRTVSFIGNSARYGGAAFFINTPYTTTVSNCTFSENDATRGGALYGYSVPLVVERCVINRNNASSEGGAIDAQPVLSVARVQLDALSERGRDRGRDRASLDDESHGGKHDHRMERKRRRGGVCPAQATLTFACSDLFANCGRRLDGTDRGPARGERELSADPLFCNRFEPRSLAPRGLAVRAGAPPGGVDCGLDRRICPWDAAAFPWRNARGERSSRSSPSEDRSGVGGPRGPSAPLRSASPARMARARSLRARAG